METRAPRPFADTTRNLRHGAFLDECAEALQAVVAEVEKTGKSGKLVVELTVKPASKTQGAVTVLDKITTKLPQLPAGETILFVTNENNLVTQDPRQAKMDLRVVEGSQPTQLKQIAQ